jgi:hypothetical protein
LDGVRRVVESMHRMRKQMSKRKSLAAEPSSSLS